MGRDHPATCRSAQTLVVVHAKVNQREEARNTPFWLHIAHGNVEFIIHSYTEEAFVISIRCIKSGFQLLFLQTQRFQ